MEYLRKSVSLRAYGQRDPLIEYRREGSQRFAQMQQGIAGALAEALPHLAPPTEAHVHAVQVQEEKLRKTFVAVSEGSDTSIAKEPIVKTGAQHERNDTVTIRRGEETQTLKYKKAEPLLAEGWVIE